MTRRIPHSAIPLLALLALALSCVSVLAQSGSLEKLKFHHEAALANLDLPKQALTKRYVSELEKVQTTAQQGGDLEQILVLKREVEAPGSIGEIPATYTDFKRARGIFDTESKRLADERQRKTQIQRRNFRTQLQKLQSALTRENKIEEAIAVNGEIAAIDALLGAEIPLGGGDSGRLGFDAGSVRERKPGKLVVWGTDSNGKPVDALAKDKDKPVIQVHAYWGSWMALTADGHVIRKPSDKEKWKPVDKIRNARDVRCGPHIRFAIDARDGSIIGVADEHHLPWVPEVKNVAKLAVGWNYHVALLADGTTIPFGYHLKDARVPAEAMYADIADVEIANSNTFVRKTDGTILGFEVSGESIELPGGLKNIVAMAGGTAYGCLFLDDKGRIHTHGVPDAPEDLKRVIQIRNSREMAAAQLADGTWQVWGKEPLAANMNAALKELGPLKDLSLGSGYFVGIQ